MMVKENSPREQYTITKKISEQENEIIERRRYFQAKGRKAYLPFFLFMGSAVVSLFVGWKLVDTLGTMAYLIAVLILAPSFIYNVVRNNKEREEINRIIDEE